MKISGSTRSNGFKLEEGIYRLLIRKKYKRKEKKEKKKKKVCEALEHYQNK